MFSIFISYAFDKLSLRGKLQVYLLTLNLSILVCPYQWVVQLLHVYMFKDTYHIMVCGFNRNCVTYTIG